MTEDQWLAATTPYNMLLHVRRDGPGLRTSAARRKFRLLACACVRRLGDSFFPPELRTCVETVERFAEGEIKDVQFWRIQSEARHVDWAQHPGAVRMVFFRLTSHKIWNVARVWQSTTRPEWNDLRGNKPAAEKAHLAHVTRCLFGNPFRQVTFDPAWRTSDAVALARGIYDDRAFDRMPILADALQDAGCADDGVLAHCRDTKTSHTRGCWVVDHVLGFS